jgi:hypothetical protein
MAVHSFSIRLLHPSLKILREGFVPWTTVGACGTDFLQRHAKRSHMGSEGGTSSSSDLPTSFLESLLSAKANPMHSNILHRTTDQSDYQPLLLGGIPEASQHHNQHMV